MDLGYLGSDGALVRTRGVLILSYLLRSWLLQLGSCGVPRRAPTHGRGAQVERVTRVSTNRVRIPLTRANCSSARRAGLWGSYRGAPCSIGCRAAVSHLC